MKKVKVLSLVCLSMFMFTGCLPQQQQTDMIAEQNIEFLQYKDLEEGQEIAEIKTNIGDIKIVLFEEQAPNTVANFKALVKEGYYDNKSIFIDSAAKSLISGATDDTGKEGKVVTNEGKPIKSEVTPNLWHFSGAVSVLGYEKNKFSKDILSDSRFFILGDLEATEEIATEMFNYGYPQKVIDAYKEHGGLPQYTGRYTVFGHVIEGMEVVNKIVAMEADKETLKPSGEVLIEKIQLSTYTKEAE